MLARLFTRKAPAQEKKQEEVAVAASPVEVDAKAKWYRKLDPATGQVFYVNIALKKSTWEVLIFRRSPNTLTEPVLVGALRRLGRRPPCPRLVSLCTVCTVPYATPVPSSSDDATAPRQPETARPSRRRKTKVQKK